MLKAKQKNSVIHTDSPEHFEPAEAAEFIIDAENDGLSHVALEPRLEHLVHPDIADTAISGLSMAGRPENLGDSENLDSKSYASSKVQLVQGMGSGEPSLDCNQILRQALDGLENICALLQDLNQETTDAEYLLVCYIEQLSIIATSAAATGLLGLRQACFLFEELLSEEESKNLNAESEKLMLLELWPMLVTNYLESLNNPDAAEALVAFLKTPAWQPAITENNLQILKDALATDFHAASICDESKKIISTVQVSDQLTPDITVPQPETYSAETALHVTARSAGEASLEDNELIQLLRDELAGSANLMAQMLPALSAAHTDDEVRAQVLGDYLEHMERLMLASEAMGLAGLQQVFAHLQSNLPAVAQPAIVSATVGQLLETTLQLALDYLYAINDIACCALLANHLENTAWPEPMSAENVLLLTELLSKAALENVDDVPTPRQLQATPDDISMAVPEDINPELLNALLQELPVQMGAFTGAVQRIAAGTGTFIDIEDAKRAAHTLKGAANTVGVRGIANLTHHLEDILIALAKHGVMPNRALAEAMLNAGDCLEAMSEALLGIGKEPEDAMHVLQDVLDWANRIDHEGVPEAEAALITSHVAATVAEPEEVEDTSLAGQLATPMLRVPASVVDEVLRLSGEMIISNGQLQERLRQARKQSKVVSNQHVLLQQLTAELENLVDIRGASARLHKSSDQTDFDPLEFEHYSELHTITGRLLKAAAEGREMSAESEATLLGLNEVLEGQHRLHIESQNAVMRTRMVAVNTIFSRLQRSVRQTCRLLDKQVELELTGAQTFVDSNVLSDLVDPLMHVLRNAIDHGIESEQVRRQRGKNPVGHIDLSFGREGNYLVVRCKDDGSGLNLDAIKAAALEKSMISADDLLTDEEMGRLILVPGFSTRAEATQVSGRGIGMDVVYSRVLEMKGSLNLRSEVGNGLTVELRIPATLISTHGLLVRLRDKLLAVSSRGVEDIHYVTPEQIKLLGNGYTYHVNEQVHEVVSLEALLDLPEDRRQLNRSGFPALMVRLDSGALRAILVQEVLDSRDLVVKSLGRYVPKSRGVIGATILDDGSVAPVIDMPELLRNLGRFERGQTEPRPADSGITTRKPSGPSDKAGRLALVIDDSLTARRAAAVIMRNAGYEVHTAMDGVEAVSMIEKIVPDIILVDMEMPRMNGLEFTAHVRNQEATRQVPVIMITSRSTDKHRQQATAAGVNAYLTKPFNSDHLLDQVATLCGRK
jgi:chemotaxis protein histidine kinase CheA